jgi:hypothetical protein
MRLAAVIIAAIFCSVPATAREKYPPGPSLAISAEYRQDALDYDDADKRFFRESARLSFMRSSASFTHVHIGAKKENRFTWNLSIKGLSPYFDCILGHYYINLGAGLIAGKKTAVSPDPLSRRLVITRSDVFIPCSSGNPLYSFQGAAAGLILPFQEGSISFRGFFSFRNRYVRNDIYYRDATGSSFNSIIMRTKKDYRYSEPAEINDYGSAVTLHALNHLTVQAYFIFTAMRRSNNGRLLWNYGDRIAQTGEKALYVYGFFSQYHDDYITIFFELGFPAKVLSSVAGGSMTERGYGLLYGLQFRHPAFSLSFIGKHADKHFYSPYSSGRNYAETAWMADITVRPLKLLSLGGAFFAEKKVSPAGNEQYLPFLRREQGFLKFGGAGKAYFSVKLSHAESGKKNGLERYLQMKASAGIFVRESILFSFSGTAQRKDAGGFSGSLGAGIKLCLLRYIILEMRYSRFFIARGDSLYASIAPFRDSISRSTIVAGSSNIFTCVMLFRFLDNTLRVRYQHRFTDTRPEECLVEASAACLL